MYSSFMYPMYIMGECRKCKKKEREKEIIIATSSSSLGLEEVPDAGQTLGALGTLHATTSLRGRGEGHAALV
jgi:hypothetical protein